MNRAELVSAAAEKAGISKTNTDAALKAIIDVISDTLAGGDSVQLVGFGTFATSKKAERTGRNPATGESITIAPSTGVHFKAGKVLKEKVNK